MGSPSAKNETDENLNGVDEIQAFLYTGPTDESDLDSEFGAPSNSMNGTGIAAGDVDSLSTLGTDLNLVPLDAPDTDMDNLSSLMYTENDGSVNPADVILVAEGVPEPMSASLLALGGALALLARRRSASA